MHITLSKPVVLVGMMGSGKTSIGHRLAERLELTFIDIDAVIEKQQGKKITEIFEQEGEKFFRDLERKVIKETLDSGICIIATGGGAFMQDETRQLIKDQSISVWLRATIDTLVERVERTNHRPLLKEGDKRQILLDLMEKRHPIYAEADLVVESDAGPHYKVVDEIIWKL